MKISWLALIITALTAAGCSEEDTAEPRVVVAVQTVPAAATGIEATVRAPATTSALSEAKVASPITASIESLNVGKGARVRAGQILAKLVASDLEAQQAEAAARVADAEANLAKVSAGTLPADIERARGAVETAAAALAEAEVIYHRREALFEEGAIPRRELLLSKTKFEQAKTAHRVATRELELLRSRSQEQDRRIAQSRLDQAKAQLDYIRKRLSYTEVRSPFNGAVTQQFLYPGDMTGPGAPVFTVMDLSRVNALAQVPEDRAIDVALRQTCRFAPVDASGQQYQGIISVVNQAVDPVRRTVEVWCEIPNPKRRLRAGVFGNVSIVTARRPEAVVAPVAGVQFEEGSSRGVVWVAGADGVAHERKVNTGVRSGDRVEILEGLRPGEKVIVEGGYGLEEGIKVEATARAEEGK